jgi:glycosyltransferase involved in cell wall biosynthesis
MKRILLYSPDVVGHPRVYCRVIADALAHADCEVVVAMGFTPGMELADCADLQPLAGRERLTLLDTRTVSARGEPHLLAKEIVALQRRVRADTTLFIEADKSLAQLRRIASGDAPRLAGRNLGIFAATSEWYPGEDSYTGEPVSLRGPTLRRTLGNIKRAVLHRRDSLPYLYEKVLIGRGILDALIVKDERLAQWRGAPVLWMPEISRPVDAPESDEDRAEYEHRATQVAGFLQANDGREPVLYFGDAAFYKGYDVFLEFLDRNPRTCGIHAGRRSYDELQRGWFRCDVDALRAKLRAEGRLLETDAYVHTQRLKELFFRSVRVYLTTHRLALSSSTMLQAMELGIPVLVPDRGLLGHRVRENGLGSVYRYQDIDDLRRHALALWSSDLARFREPIARFWQRFSHDAVAGFFREVLLA